MNSIRTAFSDANLMRKVGIVFGIFVVIEAISFVLSSVINVSSMFPFVNYDVQSLFIIVLSFIGPLFGLPFGIYLLGYQYSIAQTMSTAHQSEPLPEHNDLLRKFKFGCVDILIRTLFYVPIMLLLGTPIVLTTVFLLKELDTTGSPDPIVSSLAFLVLLAFIFIMLSFWVFITIFIVPTIMYIFIQTHSLGAAFSLTKIKAILAQSWLTWLVFYLITFVFGLIGGLAQLLLCCIPIFAGAFIDTIILVSLGSVLGSVYVHLNEKRKENHISL